MSGMRDAPRAKATANVTALAFDFGTKKIGVAVGDTALAIAHPLATIRGDDASRCFDAIAALIDEWSAGVLVVGRPLHADGREHPTTALADAFARELTRRFAIPVVQVDERYTSRVAAHALAETGAKRRARRAARDEVAAQTILQAWLDEHRHHDLDRLAHS